MKINYKGEDYELFEMVEPCQNTTSGIISVFRSVYNVWKGTELCKSTKAEYESAEDGLEKYEFVGYFYGADDYDIVRSAEEIIDSLEK